MNRAVIYARFSSSKQKEESIEGQVRICTAFAEKNDYKIVGHYIDCARSGRTDERLEFQRMILESARRKFDYILVYQLDRFARNRYDSAVYKMRLKKNGVRVISATEYLGEGPSSILFESMLEGYAEYYSAELAQKIKRGMTENALKSKWNCRIPLGYYLDDNKHLCIDENVAPIIRKAFKMYVENYKIVDIMKALNEKFVAVTGRKLSPTAYTNMFGNTAYIGTYRWNDIEKENAFPPLIPKEIFMQALSRHNNQKHKVEKRISTIYLLSSKIFCGRCGAAMTGMSGKSRNGETHFYYACHNKRANKTCDMKHIPAEIIENAVVDDAVSILSDKKLVELIADEAMKMLAVPEENTEIDALKAERKEVAKKLNNCLKALENGAASDSITQRIIQHEDRLKAIDLEIANAEIMSNPLNLTKERIVFYLMNGLNKEKRREFILTALVNKVVLNYDEATEQYNVEVTYNYSDNIVNCNNSNKAVRFFQVWWN